MTITKDDLRQILIDAIGIGGNNMQNQGGFAVQITDVDNDLVNALNNIAYGLERIASAIDDTHE